MRQSFFIEIPFFDQQVEVVQNYLKEMLKDKLVKISDKKLILTEEGRPFLRNACMALDERLRKNSPQTQVFSKAL